MDTFAWIPSAAVETIESFNERLAEFCDENNVVDVDVDVCHDGIKVCCVTDEDLPVPVPILVQPVIIPFGPADLMNLERFATEQVDVFKAQHSEQSPQLPVRTKVLMRVDDPKSGYLVIVLSLGLLPDDESEGGEAKS